MLETSRLVVHCGLFENGAGQSSEIYRGAALSADADQLLQPPALPPPAWLAPRERVDLARCRVYRGADARSGCARTAAAAFALTGCSAAGASSERPAPVVTTPSAPEGVNPRTGCLIDPPSEVPRSHEELVAELEIPAGLEPEEYAQEYLNRLEQWYMSGATEEACNNFYDFSKTTEVRRGELLAAAREDSKIFADALYVPDWEQRYDLQDAYESIPKNGAVMAGWWIKNHRDGTEDFQFKINYGSTDVLVNDGDGNFIIAISGTQDTNWEAMENDVTNIKALDGVSFDVKLSVQTQEDGTMKIANFGAAIPATQQ